MTTNSRWLLCAAGIGLLLTFWFLFLRPDPYVLLRPTISPQHAEQSAMQALQHFRSTQWRLGDWQVEQEENSAAEQYLQQLGELADFQKRYGDTQPLVYWKIVSRSDPGAGIWVNQKTGRVEAIRGFALGASDGSTLNTAQVLSYLKEQFHTELTPAFTSQLAKGKVLTTYKTDGDFQGLQDLIEVETIHGKWTGFTHRLVAPKSFEAGRETFKPIKMVAGLSTIPVLVFPVIGLYYFLFRAKKLVGMHWQTPVVAGILTALAIWLQDGLIQGFVEGLLYGVSVVVLIQVLFRGQFDGKLYWMNRNWTREKVALGYCLFGIQAGVGVLYAWVVEYFGGWMSDVQGKEMIALSHWPLLLPLATGLAAAIYEELVYRKLADVYLRRLVGSTWLTGLLASLLWSIGHLGYDVAPWYLRIIELGLVVGPLSFWMYRKYGLFPTILAHFLYNLFVTCHDLVSYLGREYSVVYLYLLVPFVLLVVQKFWRCRLIR